MTDAIVIGSGPNGLAAAIRLAEAGRSVLVLERNDRYGGAVFSEELTLPGFLHDTFSSVYPAGAASPVFDRMPLADHGLEWVHPDACYAHPLDDGRAGFLFREMDRTVAALDALRPGDGAAWERFASPLLDAYDGVRTTMLSGFPPVRGPLRLLVQGGPLRAAEFGSLVVRSAVGLGRSLFDDPGARAWLYGAAMHGDTPPHKPGGAIAAAYLNLLGHRVGWPSPRGGAVRLADALVGHLRSLGGELRLGCEVTSIVASGGRVTGVRTADEELRAPIVIGDVLPWALVRMAGDALPGWYRDLLKRYKMGPATVKVDWALDGPIPWLNEDVTRAGTVHVAGDEDAFLASVEAGERGVPERPFLLLGQQSIADPSRAPEGKHTAWAYTHAPRPHIDWRAETPRHVERIEAQVERFAPGFRDRILARHVLGPDDLQARNPNLLGGDVGGGSYRFRQLIFRPVPSLSPYRTPLDGLYIGSAATFPGGAVHGVPGDAAAAAALRDAP